MAEPKPQPPAWQVALTTVGLAIGVVAIGAYMLDYHGHVCEACGRKWRHLGAFNFGDVTSHTCKQCGTVQWWKDGTAHVLRSSLQPLDDKTIGVLAAKPSLALPAPKTAEPSLSTALVTRTQGAPR